VRTIRISDEVWNAIAKVGKFGETPDDVLRRVLKVDEEGLATGAPRQRVATNRMTPKVDGQQFTVAFAGGETKSWPLPRRDDKPGIRRVRDSAVEFARKTGATQGQIFAVMKALTESGYYVSR